MLGLKTIAVSVCLIALATCAWSQNPAPNHSRVPAQIDPRTGEFRLMQPDFEVLPVTPPTTGKFVVNFTITVASTLPTSDVISCNVTTELLDISSQLEFLESATVAATRTTGKATCSVTIPYSWILVSAGSDKVLLSFEILAPATTAGSQYPNRLSNHGFANITPPPNGTTTTFTLTPTI